LANADLPLSVAMTTVSTLASMVALPLNLMIYIQLLLATDEVKVQTSDLVPSLILVTSAVLCGLAASHVCKEQRSLFGKIGSMAGALLMVTALLPRKSENQACQSAPLFQAGFHELMIVSLPCVLGLILAAGVSFLVPGISPAARTTLAIETCFQNTAIAITVAEQNPQYCEAQAIPLLYGAAEIVFISAFALTAWQMGWTYAPATDTLFKVLLGDYQPCREEIARNVEMTSVNVERHEALRPSIEGFSSKERSVVG